MRMRMIWRELGDFWVDDEGFWRDLGGDFLFFIDSGDALLCVRDHSSIDDADRRLFFLAEIVRRPVVCPIFDSLGQFTLVYFYFWTLRRSRIHLTCTWALIHCLPPFSHCRIPLRWIAALSTHYSFIFYFVTYHHSPRFYGWSCCMGQWMDVRSLLGCFILLFVGMFLLLLEHFLVWGSAFPFFDSYILFSHFWGLFQFQGVLSGTLLRSRECVGISGGCASVHNAPLSPESRYIPDSYCFLSFFGL